MSPQASRLADRQPSSSAEDAKWKLRNWLPRWLMHLFAENRPKNRSRRTLLSVEQFEDRITPSSGFHVFTVLNSGDNGGINPAAFAGTGTLRQAIIDANATPGADLIRFSVNGGGTQTITLAAALPTITEAVT